MLFFSFTQVETRERTGVNSAEPGPGYRADRTCRDRMREGNLLPRVEVNEVLVSCSSRVWAGRREGGY